MGRLSCSHAVYPRLKEVLGLSGRRFPASRVLISKLRGRILKKACLRNNFEVSLADYNRLRAICGSTELNEKNEAVLAIGLLG
jgi:hypothetical protein